MNCKCGRAWTHCRICGSKNIYRKKFDSNFRTQQAGHPVDAYLCKKCGRDFDSDTECLAPPETRSMYTSDAMKNTEKPAIIDINSPEYFEALKNRASELMSGKKPRAKTIYDAHLIMKAEGWEFELDPSELPKPVVVEEQSEPIQPPISIDDIVRLITEGDKDGPTHEE
jgi:hypothetical protein